jgi:hypothetical protein
MPSWIAPRAKPLPTRAVAGTVISGATASMSWALPPSNVAQIRDRWLETGFRVGAA